MEPMSSHARPLAGGLARTMVDGASVLDVYDAELGESGLLTAIDRAKREFDRTVSGETSRGNPYGFGGMRADMVVRLYGLVRESRPGIVVETGVCNGESSALILQALARNQHGVLHSIDYPEIADSPEPDGGFWTGKKGAVIPKDKQPGWVIPDELRRSWTLTLGRSQDVLEPLLQRLGLIDFFFHDSEHSEECMRFEYHHAWEHLRAGGVLVSDDITWNMAFEEFSRRVDRPMVLMGRNTAFIVK